MRGSESPVDGPGPDRAAPEPAGRPRPAQSRPRYVLCPMLVRVLTSPNHDPTRGGAHAPEGKLPGHTATVPRGAPIPHHGKTRSYGRLPDMP